ncbi:MAG: hypothetical protein HOV97_35490 [Nonomuraea sp.]|nr:hypothetical protein [Nonomuraea sp.]NUS07870.1 hypothetical protein [Nonomuraea sp.]
MRSRTEAVLAGLVVLALAGGCAGPATQRVSLEHPPPTVPSESLAPSLPRVATEGATPAVSSPAPVVPTLIPATSLAEPLATAAPLAATGPPRFFLTARPPIFREVPGTKTSAVTPVRAAVNDAETGAFVAEVPLPPGVPSSWQLVAAAPDNRTFVLGGWTGSGKPFRFYRVRLDENGEPGEPELVPDTEPEPDHVTTMALSRDGTRLAYACAVVGGGTKVAVLDLATGQRRDWLTPSMIMGLAWAPDGRHLGAVGLGWGVGLLDLGAGGADFKGASRLLRSYTEVPIPESIAFTPDGGALLYSAGHNVVRLPVEGGEPQVVARLTLPASASLSLRFSLDGTGRHLLCTHAWRAYRVDLTDGSTTSVPIDAGKRSGEGAPPVVAW